MTQHPRSSSDPPPLNPLVACRRYEPREHPRPLALARPELPPSPLSDRVGYSDHVRFRGYFPVHCISAYKLPAYASQRPLPEHHARLVPWATVARDIAALDWRCFRDPQSKTYFRLLIAVRSKESLAMPAAPHQLEAVPPGLIGVTLVVPVALKALVKALQLPLLRSVSE